MPSDENTVDHVLQRSAHAQPFATIVTLASVSQKDIDFQNFYFVEVIMEGSAILSHGEWQTGILTNEVWAKPNVSHKLTISADYKALRLYFDPLYWNICLRPFLLRKGIVHCDAKPSVPVLGNTHRFQKEIEVLRSHLLTPDNFTTTLLQPLSHQLVLRFLENLPILPFKDSFIEEVFYSPQSFCYFLEANFIKRLKVEDLANAMRKSLSDFKRFFAIHYDKTPTQWLIHRRLNQAFLVIYLYHYSDETAALISGFPGTAHFIRSFKNKFGISTTQVRSNAHFFRLDK